MKQAADEVRCQTDFILPVYTQINIKAYSSSNEQSYVGQYYCHHCCHRLYPFCHFGCLMNNHYVIAQAGLELNMELPGAQSATIGQSTQVSNGNNSP